MSSPQFFSIVIPTHRRVHPLERAVESVPEESNQDWEPIFSDDEKPSGDAWKFLESLCRRDSRFRRFRNTFERGQVGDTNRALSHALGKWVKPLHDDDLLHADRLETLYRFLADGPLTQGVGPVSCRADRFDGRRLQPWVCRASLLEAEIVDRRHAGLAMYLQEDIGSLVPPLPLHSVFDHRWRRRVGFAAPVPRVEYRFSLLHGVGASRGPSDRQSRVGDQAGRSGQHHRGHDGPGLGPRGRNRSRFAARPLSSRAQATVAVSREIGRVPVPGGPSIDAPPKAPRGSHARPQILAPAAWPLAVRMAIARFFQKNFAIPRRKVPVEGTTR